VTEPAQNDDGNHDMKFTIREMRAADQRGWAEMRTALWPTESLEAHASSIDELLTSGESWGFIAETPDGTAAGFAEIAIRKYANGCDSRPVAFLEGIWVKARLRRQGIGARLIRHVETFLTARGFRELGSDALLDNVGSQAAHLAWGFSETERVVYFRRILSASTR
jgi:aminoglycoside 6'-N-acetyltransferase I